MSEDYQEPGVDAFDDFEHDLNKVSPYVEVVHELVNAQHEFLDAAALYFVEPTLENQGIVPITAANMARRMSNCLEYITVNVSEEDERNESILELILEEEARHVEVFSQLHPCEKWDKQRYTRQEIREIIVAIFANEEPELILSTLLQNFVYGVQADLDHLCANVLVAAEPEAPSVERGRHALLRTIGKHAFDIAKIGAGVTAGILVAKSLHRK